MFLSIKKTLRVVKLITLTFIFFNGILNAQSYDSADTPNDFELAKELLNKDPEKALKILNKLENEQSSKETPSFIGDLYFQKGKTFKALDNFEKANEYCTKAIQQYQNIGAFQNAINTMHWQGEFLLDIGKSEQTLVLFNEAIKIAERQKDTLFILRSKIKLIGANYDLTKNNVALKIAYEVLDLMKIYEAGPGEKIDFHNILGNIHSQSKNIKDAIINYEKALAFTKIKGDYKSISFLNINIGILYSEIDSIDLAGKCFKEAFKASKHSKNPIAIAFSNMLLANYLIKIDESMPTAQNHLEACLKYFRQEKEQGYECFSTGLLGITEMRLGNSANALKLFDKVEELAPKHSKKADNSDIFGLIAKQCSKDKFYQRAYHYKKLQHNIDKEIYDEKSQSELLQIRTEYETKEKEKEIAALKDQNFNQGLIGFLLLAFITALGVFLFNSWSHRQTLKTRNEELKIAQQKAEELARSKSDFLATMSHEIRTPMNGVIGMVNILADDHPRPEQMENLEILKFSADNLLNLINDILDISKINSGKIELEKNDFNLEDHIKKLFSIFKTANKKRNVKLNLDIQLDCLRKQVIGDTLRLNQVMTNLVNNAIKFTNEGSVSLKIKTINQSADSAKIKFEVIDTGIGISKENQKSIFEKYQQAENETSRLYGGTGLGLNIAKELIELYGGKLQLKSEIGKGSNFFFEVDFPLSKKPITIGCDPKSINPESSFEGMKILLAEDNKVNQIVAKRILNKWRIDLTIAQNGLEAVELFKSNDFDLILMDIQMPEMDGFEATKIIRKLPNGKLPIYSMTASSLNLGTNKEGKELMDGHIGKPFNPKELQMVLCKHLPKKEITSIS